MVAAQPNKPKTKAKQRYLKAKKERRKQRKTVESLHKATVKGKVEERRELIKSKRKEKADEELSESAEDSSEVESFGEEPTEGLSKPITKTTAVTSREEDINDRPRKRRKVTPEREPSVAASATSSSSSNEEEAMSADEPVRKQVSPVLSAPLVGFEMPKAENAASQEELALQGLDPGLIGAELVDSTQTASIDSLPPNSLTDRTKKRLKDLGITELFAVQTALLPFLLPLSSNQRALYMPYNPPRDVCVSAPTGSGKTLAYVVPILELLSKRAVTRLRALIVLPTRDLVTQVRETFEALGKGHGLKIASATGQHSFAHEQSQLVEESDIPLRGGSSKVDILICTPGRLIDHIKGTRNFTLQHLRFLVIDEADRLLAQSFQDWLAQVLEATRLPSNPSSPYTPTSTVHGLPRHDAVSPAWQGYPPWRSPLDEPKESSCQKLLFSATLTRDPAKIAALELRDAKYFIVTDKQRKDKEGKHLVAGEAFAFPATLSEHMIVCSTYKKPLMLFYLLHRRGVSNALIFTKSTESTNRLVKLFQCFENALGSGENRPVVHAYSSDLSPSERKTILDKFKAQEITMLICSDLISRGIDISHVSHVVSYDAPVDMRKYVHRVGRTARAGRSGDAWSLIEEQEARYFKKIMTDANHMDRIKKLRVSDNELKDLNEVYEVAMKAYSVKMKVDS